MQHILIVEDNEIQLNMLVKTIMQEYPDWKVDFCKSYDAAMNYIKDSLSDMSMQYTLFLLDIQLTNYKTDRGGFLIAEEIRKIPLYFRTNILFLTGISDEGLYALSNFHCYNYITNNVKPEDICYVQSQRHLKTIYFKNAQIKTRAYSLDELKLLTGNKLITCHKSYLINPTLISSFDKVTLSVTVNGVSLPVGKKYSSLITSFIEQNGKRKP